MKYLWIKQTGEGCDYTIGCGNALVEMEGRTVAQILEDYGFDGEERKIEACLVLAIERDAMDEALEYIGCVKKEHEDEERAEKEAEFERLKRELGK